MKFCARIVLGICLLAMMGCGSDTKLAPISGVVTLNEKPLEGATVTFSPIDTTTLEAPTSFATTDAEGRYELETATGERGAFIGKHKVAISKVQGGEGEDEEDDSIIEFESEIPMKYNEKTTLIFDVTNEGSDKADFDLKAEKGWQKEDKKKRREQDPEDDC